MKTIDSLDSHTARAFAAHELVDENGGPVGKIDSFWFDPSTHRVAFVGVKTVGLSGKVKVDASEALERTQKEAKSRDRAGREKRGDLE